MDNKDYKPARYKDGEEVTAEKKPKKKNSWLFIVLIIFFSAVFVVALSFIIKDFVSEKATEDTAKKTTDLVEFIGDIPSPEQNSDPVPGKPVVIDPTEIFSVKDFSELERTNSDTIGWFYMPCYTNSKGLPINLPMLHTSEPSYYLSHNFYKQESVNGWLYVASECNGEDLRENRNTLVYAHARSYKMFGGLKNLNSDKLWQENRNSHFIKISTPYEDSVWEIFSWHETTVHDNYWQTSFSSDAEFLEYANRVQGQDQLGCFSSFEFTPEDRIITLSTCKGSNEDVRVAVHAKLIVSSPRDSE